MSSCLCGTTLSLFVARLLSVVVTDRESILAIYKYDLVPIYKVSRKNWFAKVAERGNGGNVWIPVGQFDIGLVLPF